MDETCRAEIYTPSFLWMLDVEIGLCGIKGQLTRSSDKTGLKDIEGHLFYERAFNCPLVGNPTGLRTFKVKMVRVLKTERS